MHFLYFLHNWFLSYYLFYFYHLMKNIEIKYTYQVFLIMNFIESVLIYLLKLSIFLRILCLIDVCIEKFIPVSELNFPMENYYSYCSHEDVLRGNNIVRDDMALVVGTPLEQLIPRASLDLAVNIVNNNL